MDHPVGVEQGQLAIHLQYPLDDEHHIGAPGIIFVKYDGDRILQRPWQDAFTEFGDLLAITQNNRVTRFAQGFFISGLSLSCRCHIGRF